MNDRTVSKSFACEPSAWPEGPWVQRSGLTASAARKVERILPWLNLLCLDAPIVAVSWQCLFARSLGIAIAPGGTAALFLTAWCIYLADRFGDSLSLDREAPTSLRQRFCRRHRVAWLVALGAIAMLDLVVCLRLEARTFALGLAVGGCAFVYLLVNQLRPVVWRELPLKESAIGFLFAAGTMAPLAPRLTSAALTGWLLFACLCVSNCVCIAVWERGLDAAQKRITIATVCPKLASHLLPALLLFLIVTSLASGVARVYLSITASAALLAALHIFRERIQPDIRTALADLVLLTPLACFSCFR